MRELNVKLKIDKDDLKKRLDIKDGLNGQNGKDGSPDTAEQIVDKLEALDQHLSYDKLKGKPDLAQIISLARQASKTVSLKELDDVDLSGVTITDGKYVLGSGGGGGSVNSVSGGTGILVNNTDPANPVVSVDSTIATKAYARMYARRMAVVFG